MFQKISEVMTGTGETLGNKGKFLCVLHQAGFQVPDGVILDCEEYRKFLQENELSEQLNHLLGELNRENVQ